MRDTGSSLRTMLARRWRWGVGLGAVAALLSAGLVLLAEDGTARPGGAEFALAASLLMTVTYHLGYRDFRSEKVRKPMAGDVIWSAPVLATLNPLGAPIAHAGLHVTAVAHRYETDLFLPPHRGATEPSS